MAQLGPEDIHARFAYHPATERTARVYDAVRQRFDTLAQWVNDVAPDGREKSLALTALQEAMMWTNAAVAMTTPVDDATADVARQLPTQHT